VAMWPTFWTHVDYCPLVSERKRRTGENKEILTR
jgi:hypothetical protein